MAEFHSSRSKSFNDCRINQKLKYFTAQNASLDIMCDVLWRKRKTSLRKQSLRCHFPRRLWTRETPTARTESHKNLLTSLKNFTTFLFTFFFIIFYGDPWRLEKQHSLYPFTLSEFLSRKCFSSLAFVGNPKICVWIWILG